MYTLLVIKQDLTNGYIKRLRYANAYRTQQQQLFSESQDNQVHPAKLHSEIRTQRQQLFTEPQDHRVHSAKLHPKILFLELVLDYVRLLLQLSQLLITKYQYVI